ncbi:hypothetical protein LTR50_007489 [Elasticomyces elasticus]|nr:hypothetical protein LTR50_007489 [Elasticomyces elasticus]
MVISTRDRIYREEDMVGYVDNSSGGDPADYVIVWESLTLTDLRANKRMDWSSATKKIVLQDAVEGQWSSKNLPTVDRFVILAQKISAPLRYGAWKEYSKQLLNPEFDMSALDLWLLPPVSADAVEIAKWMVPRARPAPWPKMSAAELVKQAVSAMVLAHPIAFTALPAPSVPSLHTQSHTQSHPQSHPQLAHAHAQLQAQIHPQPVPPPVYVFVDPAKDRHAAALRQNRHSHTHGARATAAAAAAGPALARMPSAVPGAVPGPVPGPVPSAVPVSGPSAVSVPVSRPAASPAASPVSGAEAEAESSTAAARRAFVTNFNNSAALSSGDAYLNFLASTSAAAAANPEPGALPASTAARAVPASTTAAVPASAAVPISTSAVAAAPTWPFDSTDDGASEATTIRLADYNNYDAFPWYRTPSITPAPLTVNDGAVEEEEEQKPSFEEVEMVRLAREEEERSRLAREAADAEEAARERDNRIAYARRTLKARKIITNALDAGTDPSKDLALLGFDYDQVKAGHWVPFDENTKYEEVEEEDDNIA